MPPMMGFNIGVAMTAPINIATREGNVQFPNFTLTALNHFEFSGFDGGIEYHLQSFDDRHIPMKFAIAAFRDANPCSNLPSTKTS